MSDYALFIGWGNAVRGRERQAQQVFNEAVELYARLQREGTIEGFDAFILEPHGGDLGGFFVVRGERERLARLRVSEEIERLNMRAELIVEGFGVVGAVTGERLAQNMALWAEQLEELA